MEMIAKRTAQAIITKELFTSFINFIDAAPKTVESYKRALRQFFLYLSVNGIKQPKRADVINYKEALKANHKPATIQLYIVAVRLFFQWASQEGYYPNITEHLKGVKLDKAHKKDALTSRQVKRILEGVKGNLRDYAILTLLFTGGLRTVEIVRANLGDLATVGNCEILYIQGKGHTEKADFVKLCPEVADALNAYVKSRGKVKNDAPLFASASNNNHGERLSTRTISGIVKKAFINAGFTSERLTAHSTRHTAVTLALLAGQKLEEVQQFARHANIQTTLVYAHNLERLNNNCELAISKAIF